MSDELERAAFGSWHEPPLLCSPGGIPYNLDHIEYWKARALKAEAAPAAAKEGWSEAQQNEINTAVGFVAVQRTMLDNLRWNPRRSHTESAINIINNLLRLLAPPKEPTP